jgi:glycosyltransferase involved in cell wall biosynthesis
MKTSIVITSHNYGRYIERCLRSCLNQKLVNNTNEIIVVDDASTDDTLKIVEKFKRFTNIHVIANPTNVGVAEAANIGIRASVGQYVVRVDADDYISEWFVFFLRSYLEENHDAFGVCCDYQLINEHEEVTSRGFANEQPVSCGIMYRRDLLVQAGLYNPTFRHCEEEELRQRVGDYYKILHLRMPLYRYRMHNSNKTKQSEYEAYKAKLVTSKVIG